VAVSPAIQSRSRKPRADAERNRQRLLEAAKASFAKTGAATSLEEIARAAEVGIGTLYRHFPTRDALVEAVYRDALDRLSEDARRLTEAHPPVEALRQWLLLFIDYISTKKLMADLLAGLAGGPAALYAASGPRLKSAVAGLVDRAKASGAIRFEGEPFDLLMAVAGLGYGNAAPGWEHRARQMVDIIIAGLQRG
jgi:AcrR family transcriptional regulator